MRTIKFRGKAIEPSLGWIYGDLVQISNSYPDIHRYKDTIEVNGEKCKRYELSKVNPDTVGQFTSLFDNNGKEIYEGDIVDCDYILYDPWDDKEEVLEPIRCVVGYEDWGFVLKEEENLYHYFSDVTNIKFIGNIHDNPELLKGGE